MNKSLNQILIAHRGESHDAPENTLAAVNLAWERGAQAVEVDVHLSKDNKIVVIHDSNTLRTGGRNKKVNSQTLEELKQLDVGVFKDEKWRGEQISLLSEVFATVPPHGSLIVEIKCGKKIIPFLKEVVESSFLSTNQIVFIAFSFKTICAIKKEFPNHKAYWLMLLDYIWINRFYPYSIKRIVNKVKKHRLDGVNVWTGKVATKQFISSIKREGLAVYLWVVNNPLQAKQLFECGADGIATDRAGWMREQLDVLGKNQEHCKM